MGKNKSQLPDDPDEQGVTVSDDEVAEDEATIERILGTLPDHGLG